MEDTFETVNNTVKDFLMSISDGLDPSIFCRKIEKARPVKKEMDGKGCLFNVRVEIFDFDVMIYIVLFPIYTFDLVCKQLSPYFDFSSEETIVYLSLKNTFPVEMASLRKKKKVATLNNGTCEEQPRSNLVKALCVPRSHEVYLTQVSEKIFLKNKKSCLNSSVRQKTAKKAHYHVLATF